MSNKNRKFKSNNNFKGQKRVVRQLRFDRHGHLINTVLKPENSSILERNLANANDFTTTNIFEEVEEFVFNDEEFNKVRENTSIVDDAGQEVSHEAQEEAHRQIVHQGTEDTLFDVIENQDIEYTKDNFIQSARKNILARFDFLRRNAEKDNEKTQENNGKSFLSRLKKVKVYARDILSMFEADKKATKAYEQKITDKAPTTKAKVLWNKCKQHKYKIAAGLAGFVLLTACVANKNKKVEEKNVNLTEQSATPAPAPKQEVKADTVVVQTVYSDSLQVSNVAWERTKLFFGDKYDLANKRLTDKIMKEYFDGSTREYVLNQLAYNITSYSEKKISEWEKALNDGLKDENTQKIVQAYRVSQQIICYLTDVTVKEFPKEAKDIFINQEVGKLDKIVESVTFRDCDNIDVKYKTLRSKTISWEQAKTIAKDSIQADTLKADTLQADTTKTQQDFVPGDGSVEFKKQDVQNDSTVEANFTYNKSNEDFQKSKKLRDATAEEVLGHKVKKDRTIWVQIDKSQAKEDSHATYNKGNNLDNGKVIAQVTDAEAAAGKTADEALMVEKDAQKAKAQSTQTGFKDLTAENKAEQTGFKDLTTESKAEQTGFKDLTAESKAEQTGFKDLTAEKKAEAADSTASANTQITFKDLTFDQNEASADSAAAQVLTKTQTGFKDLTAEKKAEKTDTVAAKTLAQATDNADYEVIAGTDGVKEGTPALESVAPRGGYNHTDVSLANIEFAKKTLGEDVYNTIVTNASNHKEWLERGSFAEGLTPEELAVITAVRTKVFPYAKSTSALRKTVICEDTLSVEMATQVTDAIKKVNQNYTIDGVVYNQPRNTVSVKHNGCDEKETVNIVAANGGKVLPSGPKLPRMFKVAKQVQQAFGIGGGSVEYVALPQDVVMQDAAYSYNKSNEGFKNSMKLSDVDGSKVFGRQPKDRTIMVEVSETSASLQGVASYNKSNEGFENDKMITTVPVDEVTGRKPKDKKVLVEQEVAQAYIQKKGQKLI